MSALPPKADMLGTRYDCTCIVGECASDPADLQRPGCKRFRCPVMVFLCAIQFRRADPMAFENIIAEINLLLEQFENQPEDAHELQQLLHEKLAEIRAMGMPLPDDLVELEKRLQEEFLGKDK